MSATITVWVFRDAPQEYRDLSTHGGDEDYIALVPADFACQRAWIDFLEGPNGFWGDGGGVEDAYDSPFGNVVTRHTLANGDQVYISAHA